MELLNEVINSRLVIFLRRNREVLRLDQEKAISSVLNEEFKTIVETLVSIV